MQSVDVATPRATSLGGQIMQDLKLDGPLMLLLIAVAALGLIVLYSAVGGNQAMMVRQLVRLGVAFLALLLVAQIPPRYLRIWTPWIFIAGLLLLGLVLVTGDLGKGAQRWLNLGFIRFQPSEILKLAVPMMIAWFLHERPLPPNLRALAVLTLVTLTPVLLIAFQPDLGTAILVLAAGAITIVIAGLSMRIIISIGILGLAMIPLLWNVMLDYQRKRVMTFLDPESDPLGAGYNIIQSKIAIGSGGLFGKGWMNGTQAHLEFLPERSTDFIFSVMGEEFGLLGLLLLLVLYLAIVGRGLFIALQAQDTFSRLLAGSISLTFFAYVFVNAGMVCGLLPVVGVPLPLVSAGGTSMVTLMAGFGMLTAIANNRKLLAQ